MVISSSTTSTRRKVLESEQSMSSSNKSSAKSLVKSDDKKLGNTLSKKAKLKTSTVNTSSGKPINKQKENTTKLATPPSNRRRNVTFPTTSNVDGSNDYASKLSGSAHSDNKPLYGDFNEALISLDHVYTKENFNKNEQNYQSRLVDLKEKLARLKDLGCNQGLLNMKSELNRIKNDSPSSYEYLIEYVNELQRLETLAAENQSIVRLWYEKQKSEIEQAYQAETRRCTLEFQEKRAELKESLRQEYEEMRKQIEIDKTCLDINTDTTDVKPPPTRNLRRRNQTVANTSSVLAAASVSVANPYDFDAELMNLSMPGYMNQSANMTTSGANLDVTVNSSSVAAAAAVATASSTTINFMSYFQTASSAYLTGPSQNCVNSSSGVSGSNGTAASAILQGVADRKRKLAGAPISFGLTDEELNEDLKVLNVKAMKNSHHHVNSSPRHTASNIISTTD